MSLSEAIATAFRLQPRLRVYLESVEQACSEEQVAFAPFLPAAVVGYSDGGYGLNAGGFNVNVGTPASFPYIPALGTVLIGTDVHTGYELAEVKLQWLICDFGRRLGHYRQAEIAVDVAQPQTERAYQTTADEAATAYYQVLRTAASPSNGRKSSRRPCVKPWSRPARSDRRAGGLQPQ